MRMSDLIALRWLGVQTHKRPWVSRGWVRTYCCYAERASRFISSTYSPKGIVVPYKPLIGIDLMSFPGCQISKCFSAAFTQQVTRLSSEGSAHVVVLAVDGEIAPGPYGPCKGSLIDLHEPAVRIDGLGNSRRGRKCWGGNTRRLSAAGTRLVGMSEKRLGELSNLRERGWPMNEAPTPDQANDESAQRRRSHRVDEGDDSGLHAKTEQEAHQRGGEIPSRRAADKAGVMVKGEHLGQAMRAHKLGHHL